MPLCFTFVIYWTRGYHEPSSSCCYRPGLVSPVGNTVADVGQSGRGQVGHRHYHEVRCVELSTRFAGEVKGFNIEDYMPAKEARHMDTFIHYGMAAGIQAMQDSGLEVTEENSERIGVMVGSGIGGLPMIEDTQTELLQRGPRRISPFFVPASIINMISGHLSIRYGLKGPNLAIVTACTTGLHCIGEAVAPDRIRRCRRHDRRRRGSRPCRRSGIGGFARRARCRSATTIRRPLAVRGTRTATVSCWARAPASWCWKSTSTPRRAARRSTPNCVGYGMSADAYHMTAPLEDGDGARRCMRQRAAQRAASIAIEVRLHQRARHLDAAGRHGRDASASSALSAITRKKMVVNSTKSMTGHLLGGAGGLGAVFTVLAMHNQIRRRPSTSSTRIRQCDLDYCANTARDMKINVAV